MLELLSSTHTRIHTHTYIHRHTRIHTPHGDFGISVSLFCTTFRFNDNTTLLLLLLLLLFYTPIILYNVVIRCSNFAPQLADEMDKIHKMKTRESMILRNRNCKICYSYKCLHMTIDNFYTYIPAPRMYTRATPSLLI